MTRPDANTPDLPGLSFPATVVKTGRADGAVLVIPGPPVIEGEEVTIAEAVKLLGGHFHRRTLQKMARQLGARQRGPRCKIRIPVKALAQIKSRRA